MLNYQQDGSGNDIFRSFVGALNKEIGSRYADRASRQRQMIDRMVSIEARFREILLATAAGKKVYDDFVAFVRDTKPSATGAQVYFRERQVTFNRVSKRAFKMGRSKLLYKLRINYLFASWVMERYEGPGASKKRLAGLFGNLVQVRKALVTQNLYLSINRAKRFWNKVPEVHLQYMDHVQNASEGLVTAIDKFVPEDGVLAAVAIGRMTLNMVTDQNGTLVKFSPKDKRVQYRANTARNRMGFDAANDVAGYVREKYGTVTDNHVSLLNQATMSPSSLDASDDSGRRPLDYVAGIDRPDFAFERAESDKLLKAAMASLSVLDRKIVRLKYGF